MRLQQRMARFHALGGAVTRFFAVAGQSDQPVTLLDWEAARAAR